MIAVAVRGVSRTRPVVNAPGAMHTVNVEYSGEENG